MRREHDRGEEGTMEKIQKSILIDAPAAAPFEYLTDPVNLLEIWPSLLEVSKVEVREDGSNSFDWTYRMAGLQFRERAETMAVECDRRRLVKNEGEIPSTFDWRFEPRGDQTEVMLGIEYELPVPLLGRLAAPFLRRMNEREAATMLENLKERLESRA
jgi:uncharacterized membrane protein